MANTTYETEYCAGVKNKTNGEYDYLFKTTISQYLAIGRAVEEAETRMRLDKTSNDYDTGDIVVKTRCITTTYSEWGTAEKVGRKGMSIA